MITVVLFVVTLSTIATVGTAWCGLEGARWNAASSTQSQVASDQHVESARTHGREPSVRRLDW